MNLVAKTKKNHNVNLRSMFPIGINLFFLILSICNSINCVERCNQNKRELIFFEEKNLLIL